jgi:hypothetical protein
MFVLDALDYLLTRSDRDGKTVVLMGGSMGGQTEPGAVGITPREDHFSAGVRAGMADSNGDLHGRKAGYPNWPSDNPEVMK